MSSQKILLLAIYMLGMGLLIEPGPLVRFICVVASLVFFILGAFKRES